MKKLTIAISQFPVSTNYARNLTYHTKHILKAAKQRADIVHFPETSLSGYETENPDWKALKKNLQFIQVLAKKNNIYVVLGSHFKDQSHRKPFNSTCVISNKGKILGRYFKTTLYGSEKKRFSSTSNFLVKKIKGVTCGFLICYDSCFPELFQEYRDQGVKLLFLSYYNAKSKHPKNTLDTLMRSQISTRAADNMMHISGSNSSARYSRMPSSFATPDGKLKSLPRHRPGLLYCNYPEEKLGWTYDNRHY